uniref:Uncharacterized protein n=1 Tax=Anguilla anguilla TaxID=7936 RepID=A0A0E9VCE1_ANGAN
MMVSSLIREELMWIQAYSFKLLASTMTPNSTSDFIQDLD